MSYLDSPRFYFSGQFWTNPSTINNATENYDPAEVYNNNPPSDTNPNSVWWNQMGQAFFKVPSGSVTSATTQNGQMLLTASGDPIVGASVAGVLQGGPPAQFGKLVDLDPDQQSRSLVVGLSLQFSIAGEPGVSLVGDVRPMTIIDLWGRVTGGAGGQGIASAGAMFQSVLENLQWNGIGNTKSAVLKQLYAVSPTALSIKFNFDGYNGDLTSQQFGSGRMVGTVGPYAAGEPAHFLAKRRVFPGAEAVQQSYPNPNTPSPMNPAPFQVSGSKLIIDLGNSVPTTAPNQGPFAELGTVSAVIDPLGSNVVLTPPLFSSADEYARQYRLSAGIFELELGSNANLLSNKPLGIQIVPPVGVTGTVKGAPATRLKEGLAFAEFGVAPGVSPAAATIALAEWQSGYFACIDLNAIRIEPSAPAWSPSSVSGVDVTSNAEILLAATLWGQPAAGLTINIQTAINQYQFRNAEGQLYNINNDPMSAISAPQQVTTDANGQAILSFSAVGLTPSQKPQRRQFVDGQLYLFTHDYSMDGSGQPLTILVFETIPAVANPTWWQDIQPILLQYARLYPFMRSLIDLSDYSTLSNGQFGIPEKIQGAISLPRTHPAYMPVTRDLSVAKTNMILTWIKNGMPEGTAPPLGSAASTA